MGGLYAIAWILTKDADSPMSRPVPYSITCSQFPNHLRERAHRPCALSNCGKPLRRILHSFDVETPLAPRNEQSAPGRADKVGGLRPLAYLKSPDRI